MRFMTCYISCSSMEIDFLNRKRYAFTADFKVMKLSDFDFQHITIINDG